MANIIRCEECGKTLVYHQQGQICTHCGKNPIVPYDPSANPWVA